MNARERNDLLIRLDEKTSNVWRILDEQEDSINKKIDKILEHQVEQNHAVLRNTIWRKVIIGVGAPVTLGIVGWLLKLTL